MEEAIPSSLCVQEILFIYREKEITVWVPDSCANIGMIKEWSPFCRSQDLD